KEPKSGPPQKAVARKGRNPRAWAEGLCSLGGNGVGEGFFYDFAVEEMHGALGVVGVARVVGDHADGGAGGVDILEQVHDRVTVLGVEVSGGLIGQENHGIAD